MRAYGALFYTVFKVRIGLAIMASALAGIAITPGASLSGWQTLVLGLAVLGSSAAAGAFNHLVERDLDARMKRTENRPFVTGRLRAGPVWYLTIFLLLAVSVGAAFYVLNGASALYVFLGAFVYGVVYTVWLKRRTVWNIVVGGLSGSFAVLAGAARPLGHPRRRRQQRVAGRLGGRQPVVDDAFAQSRAGKHHPFGAGYRHRPPQHHRRHRQRGLAPPRYAGDSLHRAVGQPGQQFRQ